MSLEWSQIGIFSAKRLRLMPQAFALLGFIRDKRGVAASLTVPFSKKVFPPPDGLISFFVLQPGNRLNRMKLHLRVTLASLAACVSVLGQAPTPPAPGAPPAAPGAPPAAPAAPAALNIAQETENLLNEAMKLFGEAKYQEALSKIAEAEKNLNGKPTEGMIYAKGACFFNLEDYPKAIENLELYVKDHPEGASITDVRMALGRAYIRSKQGDKGVAVLKEVVGKSPEKKAEAGLIIADHYKAENKADDALQILSAVLADGVRSPESIQAAMMASQLYVAGGKLEEASALMDKVRNFASGGDNIAQMNNIYLQLGDQMMEKKAFQDALNAYQLVRRKSEISRIQKEQIAKIEARLKSAKGDQKAEFETKLKAGQEILAEIEKRTDYDASLYYRLGRCYFEMGQPPSEGAAGDPSRLDHHVASLSRRDFVREVIDDFVLRSVGREALP